ncbi:YfcL family protein [Aestuariibacter sp. GS-14]|uniref:YfcL family protein n=1 Tax=Aestuariibacter sp. GS-14 TaxID=2590670 RepID=UPI00112B1F2B|nr:YfcL family protein [Aestuariibacter sp. GS-14]TPV60726.1 YfcL family protein [Aestuariibacter sp. GS-14]
MQEQVKAPASFVQLVNDIDTALDNVVDTGSDDALFIASYLQGHFAVQARKLELEAEASAQLLNERMQTSLSAAFKNKELEGDDQTAVLALWQQLLAPFQ